MSNFPLLPLSSPPDGLGTPRRVKRPVSPSVAEPADTPVVMVAVAADETATIGSVPLPNSARVDEDCGNLRYYFVGNMKHVLYGMVVLGSQ